MFAPNMTTLDPFTGEPRPGFGVITCLQCKKNFYQKFSKPEQRSLYARDARKFCSVPCYEESLRVRARAMGLTIGPDEKVDPLILRASHLRRKKTPEELIIARRYNKLRQKAKELHGPTMAMLSEYAGDIELKEVHGNRIRARIASRMLTYLDIADAVITGQVKWSPVQARVFGMLLDKTTPNLSASYIKSESVQKPLTELSREELELIASGVGKAMLEQRELDADRSAIPAIPAYDKFESDVIDEELNS
jgi:hypothetical protein